MLRRLAAATLATLALGAPTLARADAPAPFQPTKASLDTHAMPAWWEDGKLGIFIHWGAYSVPAYAPPGAQTFEASQRCTGYAEWYWFVQQLPVCQAWQHHLQTYGPNVLYDDFVAQWNPERFDPDAWIRLFRRAGARYMVLVAKHHDGVALWCSSTTRRDTCDMGPRRDLVSELFAAAHRADDAVRPGLYYSIPEWYNPAPRPASAMDGAGVNQPLFNGVVPPRNAYTQLPVAYTGYEPIDDYAAGQVRPQLRELIDRFHPSVLWCDIGGNESYFRSNETIAHFFNAARTTNPEGVVVDDRCGDRTTHGDFKTPEYSPRYPAPPFEATRGMGSSFGYNAQERDADYLTRDDLIGTLVSTVAHGGNLLLNVGPKADGTIPDVQADRLEAIGDWLAINGEAIYGTRRWKQPTAGDVRFTVGPSGFLYATALSWPGRELTIDAPVPIGPRTRVALLGSDERALRTRVDGTKLVVVLPSADRDTATRSRGAYTLRIGPRLKTRALTRQVRRSAGRLTVTGRLALPRGVTATMGCRGRVTVTAHRARGAALRHRATITRACRYRATFTTRARAVRRVAARFDGNPVLLPTG